LILDHEEAVVAVTREHLDQHRECRHRHNVHRPRNNGAGVNGEVHAVNARYVPGRQDVLSDRGLLLRGDLGSSLRRNGGAGLLCGTQILFLRRVLILRSTGRLVLLASVLILLLRRLVHLRRLALLRLAVRGSLASGLAFLGGPMILLRHAAFLARALSGGWFLAGLWRTLGRGFELVRLGALCFQLILFGCAPAGRGSLGLCLAAHAILPRLSALGLATTMLGRACAACFGFALTLDLGAALFCAG